MERECGKAENDGSDSARDDGLVSHIWMAPITGLVGRNPDGTRRSTEELEIGGAGAESESRV